MEFKKLFLKAERFILYINFIFAFLLLFSYLSAIISPQKFWPIAFLGIIYPVLLFVNFIFCVYWAIRLKRYFLISAVSIVLGFHILLNSIGFNYFHKISLSSKEYLKLMTYNVHNFGNPDLSLNLPTYQPILKLINLYQPDVIGFEEFNTRSSRFKICDSLKKILNTDQLYFAPFVRTPNDSTGLALFSKYPIINRGIIRLSNKRNENQVIYIDIKINRRLLRVYDFHLQSTEFNQRDNLVLNDFFHRRIVNVHGLKKIVHKLKQAFITRGQQVDTIRAYAAKCPYSYILMGDFNDTPSSYAFNQLATGMKNTFEEKGTGIAKTFSGFSSLPIDYILVSKQFHVLDCQIIHKAISDHFPVFSTVALN
jgi:endonuclease/exonuclease/phosphatase family metal-dependent hydrolase